MPVFGRKLLMLMKSSMRSVSLCSYFGIRLFPLSLAVLSVRFGIEEETIQSWLWYYAECLAMLKEELIQMPESFPEDIKFPCVVDGTGTIYEPAHNLYPLDRRFFGHKRNIASWNYQVTLSATDSRLLGVHGPYPVGAAFNDASENSIYLACSCLGPKPPGSSTAKASLVFNLLKSDGQLSLLTTFTLQYWNGSGPWPQGIVVLCQSCGLYCVRFVQCPF